MNGPTYNMRFSDEYKDWMREQAAELDELVTALVHNPPPRSTDEELSRLVEKNLDGLEAYVERRKALAGVDILAVFHPMWCTTLEKSFFWLGGCRPTMAVRLIYGIISLELDSRLEEILQGIKKDDICDISAEQLGSINDLHIRTVGEEDRLSRRMAKLQEDVADQPLLGLAIRGVTGMEAMDAIEPLLRSLKSIILEADALRMNTTREMLRILSPRQRVEFLIAMKQSHLSFHEWGLEKDAQSGVVPNLGSTQT